MGGHVIDAVQHLNVADSIQVTVFNFFFKEEKTSSFVFEAQTIKVWKYITILQIVYYE